MYSSGCNVKTIILKIGKNLPFCEPLSFKKHFAFTPLNFQ